ncbi:hypothetical protein KI387_023743, partial [Taxus chinensis]
VGVAKVYIYLKPKLENGKYIENEFKLLEFPKGKHIMGMFQDEDSNFSQDDEGENEEEEL